MGYNEPMRVPVRSLTLGLLLAATAVRASAQEAGLEEALAQLGASVAIVTDADLVHRADFNGDGRPDIAAVVESDGRTGLVIFTSSPRGYQAHPLYTSLPGPVRLRVVPPGRHRVLGAKREIELEAPGVELVFPGKSSAMYVWRGGRYQVHATENY